MPTNIFKKKNGTTNSRVNKKKKSSKIKKMRGKKMSMKKSMKKIMSMRRSMKKRRSMRMRGGALKYKPLGEQAPQVPPKTKPGPDYSIFNVKKVESHYAVPNIKNQDTYGTVAPRVTRNNKYISLKKNLLQEEHRQEKRFGTLGKVPLTPKQEYELAKRLGQI